MEATVKEFKSLVELHKFEKANKGFYLDDTFKWEIVTDNYGNLVLIPTRK